MADSPSLDFADEYASHFGALYRVLERELTGHCLDSLALRELVLRPEGIERFARVVQRRMSLAESDQNLKDNLLAEHCGVAGGLGQATPPGLQRCV